LNQRKAWLVVTAFAIIVAIITLVPYLIMDANTPPGNVFLYTMGNNYDQASYQAWIKQAEEGKILAGSNYTTERQSGKFFNPFFVVCGWFVKITGFGMIFAYQLIRLFFVVVLILVLFKFSELFLKSFPERFFFVALVSLFSGLSFLFPFKWLQYLKETYNIGPLDLWVPEANIFITLLEKPLFMMALILILITFMLLFKVFKSPERIKVYSAGFVMFLLGLVHPYDFATIYGTVVLFLLWTKADRKRWVCFFGVVVLSLPALIYEYMLSVYDPFLREWGKTLTLSSTIYSYLLGYGFILIAAAAFTIKKWRKLEKTEIFLLSWVVSHLILAYMPIRFERRLLLGLSVPLALLASLYLFRYLWPYLSKNYVFLKKHSLSTMIIIILITIPSNIRYVVDECIFFNIFPNNYCLANGDYEAFLWMDKNLKRDTVVFAFYSTGVYMPGLTGCKVYAGHYDQTLNAERKKKLTGVFYQTNTSDYFRVDLLKNIKAKYLYFGSFEKNIGDPGFDSKPYLSKVYDKSGVKIYLLKGTATINY